MSTTSAMRAWFLNLPPRNTGKQTQESLALGLNAIATVWGANAPKNKCFISIENPSAAAITVGFGNASATATDGASVPPGGSRKFWITPRSDTHIAVSAVCSAYVCSPEFDGPAY